MATTLDPARIAVCLFPDYSVRRVASLAGLCERLGFGYFGVGDVQGLWTDPYVGLTLAAQATTRIRIGPWVTNPVTRHPLVTANAMAALADLSAGRAFLGIGVGDGAVRTLGEPPATLARLGNAVALVRSHLESRPQSGGDPVPIYWAASGPRSTREGGRLGDGVIVSGWIVPDMLRAAVAAIAEGTQRGGRDPVLRIFNTALAIDDDGALAVSQAKPYVARALARASSAKVPGWSADDVERFRKAYDYGKHFRTDHELARLVPDHLVSKKAIAGTATGCARLLRQVLDSGFDRVAVIPMGRIEDTLGRLVHDVLPLVGGGDR